MPELTEIVTVLLIDAPLATTALEDNPRAGHAEDRYDAQVGPCGTFSVIAAAQRPDEQTDGDVAERVPEDQRVDFVGSHVDAQAHRDVIEDYAQRQQQRGQRR